LVPKYNCVENDWFNTIELWTKDKNYTKLYLSLLFDFFLDKECNFVVMCKEKYYKEEEKINLFKKKDEMLMAV